MVQLPVIQISRFVTIEWATIVQIQQYDMEVGADPPVTGFSRETWGYCNTDSPDRFIQCGDLADTLNQIASPERIMAAAVASPTCFAKMAAAALQLGRVLYPGAISTLAARTLYPDLRRFCVIGVEGQALRFHTLVYPSLMGEQTNPPGIYFNAYSFPSLSLAETRLVEQHPDGR